MFIFGLGLVGAAFGFTAINYGRHFILIGTIVGLIVGGLSFRVWSKNWPRDRTAVKRQVIASIVAVLGTPSLIYLFSGY